MGPHWGDHTPKGRPPNDAAPPSAWVLRLHGRAACPRFRPLGDGGRGRSTGLRGRFPTPHPAPRARGRSCPPAPPGVARFGRRLGPNPCPCPSAHLGVIKANTSGWVNVMSSGIKQRLRRNGSASPALETRQEALVQNAHVGAPNVHHGHAFLHGTIRYFPRHCRMSSPSVGWRHGSRPRLPRPTSLHPIGLRAPPSLGTNPSSRPIWTTLHALLRKKGQKCVLPPELPPPPPKKCFALGAVKRIVVGVDAHGGLLNVGARLQIGMFNPTSASKSMVGATLWAPSPRLTADFKMAMMGCSSSNLTSILVG